MPAVRITYSEAEREIASAGRVTLRTINARLADAAWMLETDLARKLDLAEACDELEHRERTGRWSPRADASPPSCVRGAVEAIARLQRRR